MADTLSTLTQPAAVAADAATPGLWAVVFAGGIGSRFWPLSTPGRPKAVLNLLGARPLIADTIHRLAPLVPPERVLVVTSHDIADAVQAAIPGVPAYNILVEPRPLGTVAALAWGLAVVAKRGEPSSVVCAMHGDLAAAFPEEFRRTLQRAAATAIREGGVVTLAVPPTRAETSFGYVVPGKLLDPLVPVSRAGAFRGALFVEKPPLEKVLDLLGAGALWHAGVVVGRTSELQAALFEHATELAPGREALAAGDLAGFERSITSVSIERGLLERMPEFVSLPLECGWDDVGTWASLRRARDLDDHGNGTLGPAVFVDSASNVVHSEAGTVVLFGCERMLVVHLDGLTFVTPLERAADLRPLLDQLPGTLRTQPTPPRP
jgi:mannose-1-phosphate guanylyltransferase